MNNTNTEIIQSVVEIDKFANWVGIQTNAAKEYLKTQTLQWNSTFESLIPTTARFAAFKKILNNKPELAKNLQKTFKEISELEPEINKLINPSSELEKESYNQIIFTKKLFQPLNFIPYLLTLWSFTRIYILPGMSFMVPLLTIIAPYLLLRYIFKTPINLDSYWKILSSLVSGNISNLGATDAAQQSITSLSPIAILKQFGWILITFVQAIIQPYWTYKHLKSVDDIINVNGSALLKFKSLYASLENILAENGFTIFRCPIPESSDKRTIVASALLQSNYFKLALKYIGGLEVIISLAAKSEINPVEWQNSKSPIYEIKNTFDYQVPEIRRKPYTINLSERNHALLTGPNRGGKSTVLRGLVTSAFLAHTYGCAIGSSPRMTPFSNMFVCLKPDDLPGNKSRFEREVEFTASTLRTTSDKPILVFIDELYHSTNPPDALHSCDVYCKQLWKKKNAISVISTHLFDLVENADKDILRMCCPAHIQDNGKIQFSYELKEGICKVSSVNDLLEENGLLRCA
jgi:hypothetical protein